MKNSQKGFVVPLLIVIVVLVIGGGIYYFAQKSGFIDDNKQSDILQPQTMFRDTLTMGTPEQKEVALDQLRVKIEKFNVKTIPEEERTNIHEIAH